MDRRARAASLQSDADGLLPVAMIFTALAMSLVLAGVLRWVRWRRCSRVVVALALALFLLAGSGLLPMFLLQRLQAPYVARPVPAWAPDNAIVLLTSGAVPVPDEPVEPGFAAYGRIVQAATMYRDCASAARRCTVLVTGGDPSLLGTPLAVTYGAVLQRLGVPVADLTLESRSRNTWQNAQFSRPLLQALGAQRIWLVTSGFHLQRGLLYFAHFGIHPTPVRADYLAATFSLWPSASNLVLTDLALHEYAGIARYHVYNALGWNAPQSAALDVAPVVNDASAPK
jgi:uncharacterized SAM-binding protein YcdF (DUF218 family)